VFNNPPSPVQLKHHAGMILIFVVLILVLLALIGTAYISATRSGRYAARQNALAAQEDMLLEGVKNIAAGQIVAALFDSTTGIFHPAGAPTSNFHDYTSATGTSPTGTSPRDFYLAERIPALVRDVASMWDATHTYDAGDIVIDSLGKYMQSAADNNLGNDPTAPTAPPEWFDIAAAPLNAGAASPLWSAVSAPLGPTGTSFVNPSDGTTWDDFRNPVIGSTTINSVVYPALNAQVAADADGDGIADAGLIMLPMASLDGLTWYYGIRIIDNNSAVNTSVAYGPNDNYTNTAVTPAQPPGNFFPTNIDLDGLLYTGRYGTNTQTEMIALNAWRFDTTYTDTPLHESGAASPDLQFRFISPYDQLWMQLGRRLSNPGFNADMALFRKISLSDQIGLARQFCIVGPSQSHLELILNESVYRALTGNSAYRSAPYPPGDVAVWFNQLFNYGNDPSYTPTFYHNPRPLLVSRNPTSNQIPRITATLPMGMATYRASTLGISKTSINTATFPELWRAFWSVMVDTAGQSPLMSDSDYAAAPYTNTAYYGTQFSTVAPYAALAASHQARMFRNPIRVPGAIMSVNFPPSQIAQLRSALAAVNAQNLLNGAINKQTIAMKDTAGNVYFATLYGTHPQPYITEIFAETQTSSGVNPNGYVAIELYNPYAIPIDMAGWHLATIHRTVVPPYTLTDLHTFVAADGQIVIPANGYAVIENYKAGNTDPTAAKYRPASAGTPVAGTEIYVPALGSALNNELVLLMPADGSATAIVDFVPVDSFDFTGLPPSFAGMTPAEDWHYQRDTINRPWAFIYPGRYDGSQTTRHQQGTNTSGPWDPLLVTDPWPTGDPALPPSLGSVNTGASYPVTFTIQLNNLGMPGPNPITGSNNGYPFGGFARNGDILQVPFIGAYRITDSTGNLIELNSVSMDSVFAEDTDTADDTADPTKPDNFSEQIGRFCPLYVKDAHSSGMDINDFSDIGTATNPASYAIANGKWHYHWASKLFDYLTVLNPNDDYTPNASTARYTAASPEAVANVTAGVANVGNENNAPIDGLININTASWKVLSTLPMVTTPSGAIDTTNNTAVAQAIFKDRIKNGPFQSMFDLNRVPGFATLNSTIILAILNPVNTDGDITPLTTSSTDPGDKIAGDFESQYLALNRISNLITTRSDSFTVYIVLEGWKNTGTANAKLITTRRAAYIIDRSGVTATKTDPQVVYMPNQ
jgi:hypothetical protein